MKNTRMFMLSAMALAMLTACQPDAQDSAQTSSAADAAAPAQSSTATSEAANVTDERLLNAENEPGQWMMVGGTYEEQHYSPLDEINRDTIDRLGLAWYADYDTNLSQQGTPLYIDGVIYVSTAWSKVYAYDAKTGEQLWQYDPKTPKEIAIKVCCGIVNRGIAAYEGKIYLGALDGNLIAIDAKTGEEVWRKMTVDPEKQYTVT
ncbi:MAG: PQQ-binding-like beta-propeller repeat protein, partial [Pseudomonadota bacterium]|nr:PQQ-binding-like beta-propeller repeat protein [Pseudomonadota bacterium]